MNPLSLLGLGAGFIGSIGKLFGRGRANREMDTLLAKDPTYSENPLAKQRLGLATTLLNARMPGAIAVERGIYGNAANSLNNVNKVATDASQAITAASNIGAGADAAFQNLGQQEAADYQRRYGNQVSAQEGLINEQDKVFQDKLRRFGDETQIRGAQSENRTNGWQDIANGGWALSDFGLASGMGGNAVGNAIGREQQWQRRGSNWWQK